MSFPAFDDPPAWDITSQSTGDLVKDALRKEQVLKEIAASQEDLRALLSRVRSVQKDCDKLTSENATLQMYIDNLTVQMAKRR